MLVITDLTREVARTADAPKPAETGRAKGPAARPAGPAAATAESDLGPLVLKRSPSPVARPAAPSSAAPVPPAPESTALEAPPEETAGEAGPPPPPATDGEEEPILVLGDQASPSPGPAEEIVPAAPPPPETPVESRPAAPSGGVLDELGTPLMVKKAKATPPGRPAATPQEPEPRPPKAAVREPARTVKKPMVILPGLDELLSEAPSGPDETPEPAAPAPREPPVKEPPAVAAPAPAAPAPSPKTEPGTPPGRDPTPEPAREASVAEASQPASTATHRDRICGLLKELVTHGGSDLHVRAGQPPSIRRGARLVPLTAGPIDRLLAEELLACMASLTTPRQMRRFLDQGDLNLSVGVPGVARFRLNYMMSRSVPAFVARVVPMDVPSLNDLHLPPILGTLAMQPRGLILVTGPSGSGKSTTLAAMIDLINCTRKGHIITLEDPLEFLHRDRECAITQREVGTDSRSFADGIRFARRMDPDVILVGEMRDLDTIRAVVQTSGAGRLVLASLGTSSATKSIDRIIGAFPAEEQSQARSNLASFLVGIVTQLLIDQVEGGRVAVHEILVATPAVRKAIRENQPQAIYSQMESGVSQGMVTLEQSLARCLKAGQISREEASARASDPQVLSGLLMK
ncbi:MAG: PilT/PilU family type 4a pilus ATPase [Candidatus Riflebacteria bacterium]|nr:PilT/PilU family type 4a pilus ATPase [Candidatus Riflebacteria bacterium]